MQVKKCKKCGEEKSIDQFGKKANGFQFACKKCANEISKEWYAERKNHSNNKKKIYQRSKERVKYLLDMVNYIKEELGCFNCGENCAICLDFHHVKGKEKNVSALVRRKNFKKIILEIEKCVCVCSNCHRKIHARMLDCSTANIDKNKIDDLIKNFEKNKPWVKNFERPTKPKKEENKCLRCGKNTKNIKYCSSECYGKQKRKVERPPADEVKKLLETMSMLAVARMFGVTDNSLRKWLKN